jgi:phage gpG-like protein
MLTLKLTQSEALAARLAALPDRLRAALAEKAEALAQGLFAQVVGVNLSGGVLNARSGALRESIELRIAQQEDSVEAEVFSAGDVPYAAMQEFGGKTAAHEILPDKARVLVLPGAGKQAFARRVQHPGSSIPARSYLRSALEQQRETIAGALAQAVSGLAAELKDRP